MQQAALLRVDVSQHWDIVTGFYLIKHRACEVYLSQLRSISTPNLPDQCVIETSIPVMKYLSSSLLQGGAFLIQSELLTLLSLPLDMTSSSSTVYDCTHSRVLVTGGLGFMPRFFLQHFFNAYPCSQIWNLDNISYSASTQGLSKTIRESQRYHFVRGDVRDKELVRKILHENNIDIVFHFAAATHVETSFPCAMEYVEVNVVGTAVLLDSVRHCPSVKRFVHISTDEVYGDTDFSDPVEEDQVMLPTNPYAASKASSDMLAHSFYKSFRVPVVVIRPCNVFGPTQHPEKLVGRFASLIRDGSRLTIQGDGSIRRCFMSVEENAEAIAFIAAHGVTGEAYNIASPHELSIIDIARCTVEVAKGEREAADPGWQQKYLTTMPDRPYNDSRYYISGQKLKDLGWEPKSTFMDYFRGTVQWYLNEIESFSWEHSAMAAGSMPNQSLFFFFDLFFQETWERMVWYEDSTILAHILVSAKLGSGFDKDAVLGLCRHRQVFLAEWSPAHGETMTRCYLKLSQTRSLSFSFLHLLFLFVSVWCRKTMNATAEPPKTSKGISIDNPNLIRELCKNIKASHSSLGRSLDCSGGVQKDESASVSMNRKQREVQLQRQNQQQHAWDVAETRQLQIPTLPTMAPSFTKAADDGVEALGGTKLGRPGYVSLIGMVPTEQTVKCIDDDFELISSFRPYQHDARRAAREAAMREKAAPHPDLLRQLKPTLGGVSPSTLIDVGSLPLYIFDLDSNNNGMDGNDAVDEEGEEEEIITCNHPKHIKPIGTCPFTNLGRGGERRRLPGQRQPVLGQYHPRFKVVEHRVTGGYIHGTETTKRREPKVEEDEETVPEPAVGEVPHVTESVMMESVAAASDFSSEVDNKKQVGSWMFASKSERNPVGLSHAPDVFYWPYPDVRSTSKRVICPVRFDIETSRRRRDLQVSGVPAGVYKVTKELGEGVRDLAMMSTKTGRDNHWVGKKDLRCQAPSDNLKVDEARAATCPHVMETVLPPRIDPATEAERHQAAEKTDRTVSIERDLNFPKSNIGVPEKLQHVRAFEKMVSRDGLPERAPEGLQLDYNANPDLTKQRARSATIHRRAPGHGSLHNPHPNELGEIPNLKWVKPNHARTTEFGAGSSRPDHLLPLKDLTYHVEPGYPHVEPRVRGNPMIGTTITRNQREKVTSTKSCGAEVMYDNIDIKDKPKLVPRFEKQITKETQFCGHRIPSERWERNNPKAPGPGFYNVKYTAVE
eukprot:gene3975-2834_t